MLVRPVQKLVALRGLALLFFSLCAAAGVSGLVSTSFLFVVVLVLLRCCWRFLCCGVGSAYSCISLKLLHTSILCVLRTMLSDDVCGCLGVLCAFAAPALRGCLVCCAAAGARCAASGVLLCFVLFLAAAGARGGRLLSCCCEGALHRGRLRPVRLYCLFVFCASRLSPCAWRSPPAPKEVISLVPLRASSAGTRHNVSCLFKLFLQAPLRTALHCN